MSLLLKPKPELVRKVFDVQVEPTQEFAAHMDSIDPLSRFRFEFEMPPGKDRQHSIYLCGNSLGLLPKRSRVYITEELDKWSTMGVDGHFDGKRPWAMVDEPSLTLIKPLLGAISEDEIAIMNSLSVNNNLLFISFYRPTADRYKIMIEGQAFCSDHHTVRSHIHLHDLRIEDALVELNPRPRPCANANHEDEQAQTLRTEDILAAIDAHGSSVCLLWLGAVQYYTGQYFDIPRIAAHAHRYGIVVGFDLAHAIGNVPLRLHDWNVDFATFCSYKYLNSGAGSIAGVFIHQRHFDHSNQNNNAENAENALDQNQNKKRLKRLEGWWGQQPSVRFEMKSTHTPKLGAQAWQISNPPILPVICLEASLEIFNEAGIHNLRMKSICLTNYLQCLIDHFLSAYVSSITPREHTQRGCQLSLVFAADDGNRDSDCDSDSNSRLRRRRMRYTTKQIHRYLTDHSVICDLRKPNVMRIAPTPLYNTFGDVWQFVELLRTFFSIHCNDSNSDPNLVTHSKL